MQKRAGRCVFLLFLGVKAVCQGGRLWCIVAGKPKGNSLTLMPANPDNRYPETGDKPGFQHIIGSSAAMEKVFESIRTAAASDANIAVSGESGTGKELVAKAIHELSPRSDHAFVPVNCGAIPEFLLESEFFGHKKGAFTNAYIDKHGYLDLADGGTLFLDEIGELKLNMQAKLLRALEGGGYHPIGSNQTLTSDFRIVAATNRDLKTEVEKGNMREDFFYRIHVIPICVPPLRDRKEDIPELVAYFSGQYAGGALSKTVPETILDTLMLYNWPGNVRELQNILHGYFSTGHLHFSGRAVNAAGEGKKVFPGRKGGSLKAQMEAFERKLLIRTLDKHDWHRIRAAAELEVTRNTLFRKMKKYGLDPIRK